MSRELMVAADDLQRKLSQLVAKLEALSRLRASQRNALLSTPQSDNWRGSKRDRFEGEFARQQAALGAMIDDARRFQLQVSQAAAQAALDASKEK
ncbi:hypothetical protein H8R03_33200 [Streptomyces sp. JH010]|uniref:hypothetical protein n=1 Tax=Streptomyces TaxID=1883 RepID=UPI0023F90ED4|nr:hypothetical protein [Streptomyces sp. JH010]MDF6066758.1 hypothetical protein [Streptomyces sp. JH010]